jgi:hypothetical protein
MKDRSHRAEYLILVGPRTARRALLFNHEYSYLSEVIDDQDGLVVEGLLDSGTRCELPGKVHLERIVPAAQLTTSAVQCFALGGTNVAPGTLETTATASSA